MTERTQIAKIAANSRWAMTDDRAAAMAPARAGMQKKFEDQVDPDRTLPAAERARRVESARKAHYQRMALASAKARAAKKSA